MAGDSYYFKSPPGRLCVAEIVLEIIFITAVLPVHTRDSLEYIYDIFVYFHMALILTTTVLMAVCYFEWNLPHKSKICQIHHRSAAVALAVIAAIIFFSMVADVYMLEREWHSTHIGWAIRLTLAINVSCANAFLYFWSSKLF